MTLFAKIKHYTLYSFLHEEILHRMMERLSFMSLDPRWVLDLGAGVGVSSENLNLHFPRSAVVAVDLCAEFLAQNKSNDRVQAGTESLPFVKSAFDMVFSHCAFYWLDTLKEVFAEVKRVSSPKALFFFATYGPDTFFELRQACQQITDSPQAPSFIDMHDIGDMLLETGFVDPVMEAEKITVDYQSVAQIVKDLEEVGDIYLFKDSQKFLEKGFLTELALNYEQFRAEGKLPLTYEIVYGHAWVPDTSNLAQPNEQGEIYIPIDQIKASRQKKE